MIMKTSSFILTTKWYNDCNQKGDAPMKH